MSRKIELYLSDILNSINKIKRYTREITYEELVDNELIFDAVVFNLQIIGEAVKNIPQDIRNICPQIEWKKIAGLRDIIAHAYFTVDKQIVWDLVQNKLNELEVGIKEIMSFLSRNII